MKCTSCGAEIRPGSLLCEYCDSSVVIVGPNGDRGWLFEHVKQSAEYACRNSPERLAAMPNSPAVGNIVAIGFLVVWTMSAAVMTLLFWTVGAIASSHVGLGGFIPLAMSVVPTGFVVIGVILLVKTAQKARQHDEIPVKTHPAIVVGKRTAVLGGSDSHGASTYYYLTAEFEDGRRVEYRPARPELFGRIAEGDAGILFTRTDVALDFDRVHCGNGHAAGARSEEFTR